MAGTGCGSAFCSFCGRCGKKVTDGYNGDKMVIPTVAPPGTSLSNGPAPDTSFVDKVNQEIAAETKKREEAKAS